MSRRPEPDSEFARTKLLTPLDKGISLALMKKVLSLLVAFIFLQVQTWALSGGPVYSGSQAAVQGTYAGVLAAEGVTTVNPETGVSTTTDSALGVFAMGVPQTGLASGAFALFVSGASFYGSILGLVDPQNLSLNALASATQSVSRTTTNTITGTTTTFIFIIALASGSIKAKLSKGNAKNLGANSSGYRIRGTATVGTTTANGTSTGTLDLTVDGFQQSNTSSGTLNINNLIGATAGG